jgi:hypothetical protein
VHHYDTAPGVEFKNKAPRTDTTPEQSPVLTFESCNVAREGVDLHFIERGVDPLAISCLKRTKSPFRRLT